MKRKHPHDNLVGGILRQLIRGLIDHLEYSEGILKIHDLQVHINGIFDLGCFLLN